MGGDEEGTRRLLITGDSCISQQLPAQREARALCARRHPGTSEQLGTPRCPQPLLQPCLWLRDTGRAPSW